MILRKKDGKRSVERYAVHIRRRPLVFPTMSQTMERALCTAFSGRWTKLAALLLICGPYLQGGLTKLVDLNGSRAEMAHFGLQPVEFFAVAVPLFELSAAVAIVGGWLRWLGALALAAFTIAATLMAYRFWEVVGPERFAAENGFFEHLAIVGALLLVAYADLRRKA